MPTYVAVITRDRRGRFDVAFPDFPGCESVGRTFTDAVDSARDALQCRILGMCQENDTLPVPTSMDEVRAEIDLLQAAAVPIEIGDQPSDND
jgi:predicted RNase H-like HicB family nuclease